jgi:soluble lytic murein transglycosylase-like protein
MGLPKQTIAGFVLVALAAALYVTGTGLARAPDARLACPVPEEAPAAEAAAEREHAAWGAADSTGLDPLLVLAVISIESRFNPLAESVMGAKGLMQIIPRYHRAKLAQHGGDQAVLDPESNIQVGARILQEYIHRTGSLEAGLQFYNGASRDESASYAQKVMAERQRLEEAMRAGQKRASADVRPTGS